jgi:hypothetical protein
VTAHVPASFEGTDEGWGAALATQADIRNAARNAGTVRPAFLKIMLRYPFMPY